MPDLSEYPDSSLIEAYKNTDYSFHYGSKTLVIKLDGSNRDFLSFVNQEKIMQWAYITAWNPNSEQRSDLFNSHQQRLLKAELKGYPLCKGEGKGRNSNWPGEESFFVIGISREDAIRLGKQFNQKAIIVSNELQEPELVILSSTFPQSNKVD